MEKILCLLIFLRAEEEVKQGTETMTGNALILI